MNRLVPYALWGILAACQTTPENVSIDYEEHVVYLSSRGEGYNLHRNSLSGDAEIKLTQGIGFEWMPQFVPRQNMMVYNSQDSVNGFQQLAMTLVGDPAEFDPSPLEGVYVSRQGDWVAWTRSHGDNAQFLRITRLSSIGDSITVGFEEFYNGRPKWSPSGKFLLFLSDESGSNELYCYAMSDGSTKRLTENDLREKYTDWGPEEDFVVTTMSGPDEVNEVYRIDMESKEITRLTHNDIHEEEISLSWSGRYLAYHARIDDVDDIYVRDVTTDSVWMLTQGQGYHGEPHWITLPKQSYD